MALTLGHLVQVFHFCGSPAVYGLIGVSDDADAVVDIGEALHQLILGDIGVLRMSLEVGMESTSRG